MAIIVGIDGCPAGWLCLCKNTSSGVVEAQVLREISDLLLLAAHPDVALIDIPIGLPDAGPRACDQEARARLKRPRASSVFPAPLRSMLAAATYADACLMGQQTDGRKLSLQAWGLLPAIRQVDRFLRADLIRQQWLREVHPELSFWLWNGQRPLAHSKKSPPGKAAREALVGSLYSAPFAAARATLPSRLYRPDDLLDAFAALWSAERLLTGQGLLLPFAPPLDSAGLRMEIVV